MTRLDDPLLVADEYADDARLRRRAAAFTGQTTAVDARAPLVAAVVAARPRRILISMSPFVANLPEGIDEPFFARRANSIFVAETST